MFLAGKEMVGMDGGKCTSRLVGIFSLSLALTSNRARFDECLQVILHGSQKISHNSG